MIEPQIKLSLLPLYAESLAGKPHKQAVKDYAATHRRLSRAARAAVKAEEKALAKAAKLAEKGLRANLTSARKNQLHLVQQYETGLGGKFWMCKPEPYGEFMLLRRGEWKSIGTAVDIIVTSVRHYFDLCTVEVGTDGSEWLKKVNGADNRVWCTADRDERALKKGQAWKEGWFLNLVLPKYECRCRWYLPPHLCPNTFGRGFVGEIEALGMDVKDELGLETFRRHHHLTHCIYGETFPRYSKVGFLGSYPTDLNILSAIRTGLHRDEMAALKARQWKSGTTP
jgi:hypothetical protein